MVRGSIHAVEMATLNHGYQMASVPSWLYWVKMVVGWTGQDDEELF